MTPKPDYGLMAADPDAYPRSIRFTLDVLQNGDLIFEQQLDPCRLDMAQGDRYEAVMIGDITVLKKI